MWWYLLHHLLQYVFVWHIIDALVFANGSFFSFSIFLVLREQYVGYFHVFAEVGAQASNKIDYLLRKGIEVDGTTCYIPVFSVITVMERGEELENLSLKETLRYAIESGKARGCYTELSKNALDWLPWNLRTLTKKEYMRRLLGQGAL